MGAIQVMIGSMTPNMIVPSISFDTFFTHDASTLAPKSGVLGGNFLANFFSAFWNLT